MQVDYCIIYQEESYLGIVSIEILKKQISRYKHEDSKYNWSKELERYVLDKLKTIKLN